MLGNVIQNTLEDKQQTEKQSATSSRRAFLAGGTAIAMGALSAIASGQSQGRPTMGRPIMGGSNKGKPMTGQSGMGSGRPGLSGGSGTMGSNSGSSGAPKPMAGANRYWKSPNLKLLRRITYGPLAEEIAEIESIGFNAYLEKQLDYQSIDDSAVETLIAQRTSYLNMSLPDLMQIPEMWRAARNASDANIYRAVSSKRQLQQKMVEFWSNHFFVDDAKLRGGQTMVFQRDVIWPNALGNFRTMLHAALNSSGLIFYLDNQTSRANNLNVNLAREVMELHTIGVDSGYTEEDIYEVGRILTGWGIVTDPTNVTEYFNFVYTDSLHEPGDKTVMGQVFTSGGKSEGDALLDWLAVHPKTGEYIGGKLVEFFLGYVPTTHQRVALGEKWVDTGGDIKEVLRMILTEDLIASVPPKFKRPYQLYAGILRQSNLYEFSQCEGITFHLVRSEHMWFRWNAPDGFPDRFDFWAPGMVNRLHYAMQFANNKVWQVRWRPDDLMNGAPRTLVNVMDAINARYFGNEMAATDQLFLRRYLRNKTLTDNEIRGAIAIALGSPGYQWY